MITSPVYDLSQWLARWCVNLMFAAGFMKKAPEEPQVAEVLPVNLKTIQYDDVQINFKAVKHFKMRARVLGHSKPPEGIAREIVPDDFLLGWGLMSSPVSARLIDHSFFYDDTDRTANTWGDDFKLQKSQDLIAYTHWVTNDFVLPKVHDTIEIEGYLVDIMVDGELWWPTDRNKIGDKDCETMLLTKVSILK